MAENKKIKDLLNWVHKVKDKRKPHENRLKQIAEYLIPNREIMMQGIDKEGKTTHDNIYNGYPIYAAGLMGNGIMGHTCGPNFPWYRFRMQKRELNEIREIKIYLRECEEQQYYELADADFYVAAAQYIRDASTMYGGMYVEEDIAKQELSFSVRHPWELYITKDLKNKVEAVVREYYMTAANAVEYFGEKKLPKNIIKDATDNPLSDHKFIHILSPRKNRIVGALGAKNKPIASIHLYEPENIKLQPAEINEGGYDSMPLITWLWDVSSGEAYPRTPASNAIKDVLMLNQMSRSGLIGVQKMVDPPFWKPLELRGQLDLNPGGSNWFENAQQYQLEPRPLNTGVQYPPVKDMIEKWESIIDKHFFVDFFLMLQQAERQMTATEIIERAGEKAAVLVSVTMHFLNALDLILGRSFRLSHAAGRMPEVPAVFEDYPGEQIRIDYLGPLPQAQRRLFKTQGVMHTLEMAEKIYPYAPEAVTDRFNWDEVMEDIADGQGMPEKNIRPMDEVEEIRAKRAEQMQQQQALAGMEQLGKAMPGLSKKPEAGSPVEQMAEQGAPTGG